MADHIILVENPTEWKPHFPKLPVVAAKDYLAKPEYSTGRSLRVLNLCRSYRYLSVGYYCSLLAEARRHRVIPSVCTLNDLSRKSIYSLDVEDLDDHVQQVLGKPRPGFTATAFFTVSMQPPLIAVSAGNETRGAELLRDSQAFAVNLLAQHQTDVATWFALQKSERPEDWAALAFREDAHGARVLEGTLGAFSARVSQLVDAGDHTLVLGEVTQLHEGTSAEPLLYANRAYRRLAAAE